jgi:hypothetical protein
MSGFPGRCTLKILRPKNGPTKDWPRYALPPRICHNRLADSGNIDKIPGFSGIAIETFIVLWLVNNITIQTLSDNNTRHWQ